MTERLSHLGAVVRLLEQTPDGQLIVRNQHVLPTCTLALSNVLGLQPDSIQFGKVILWISAFISDGQDALGRASLREQDRSAAIDLYEKLTAPYRYPYQGPSIGDHKKAMLAPERRSYISLLDEIVLREFPIFIPNAEDIKSTLNNLRGFVEEFHELDVPDYMKKDFKETVDLYVLVAERLPMVAHRVISEESGRFIKWLLSSIPDNAKQTVAKTALAINVLVAAFVAPAEAADAASSYYAWYNSTAASSPAIEFTVAPKALPAPIKKLPIEPSLPGDG